MNTNPETDLDLEKLFLPAWAQEPSSVNRYAKFEGGEEPRRDDRRQRGNRPPPRRDLAAPAGRERPRFGGREGGRPPGREGRDGGGGRHPQRQDRPREDRREPRREPAPLPEIIVTFRPDEKGADSLARQIKMTGRAYPLFDIALMILQKPDRHWLIFEVEKKPNGQPVQPLFLCALDESLWLSEGEAVAHVLNKHFATFYQPERTATEPPKGKYTFVAQCGLSGVILGPPNYHDYQNQLRKLHAERFARMPFENFKARVKIVRDEAVVAKWVEDQSWKTEYICLNMPEPLRLANREAVEKHFRENHLANIIKPVEMHTLSGTASRSLRCPPLARLAHAATEDQRRFPLQIATVLSQQFAARGLQFFKVNRTVTHVSVARPFFLDLDATPVSDGVKRIVQYINSHAKCTRRQLFEALAPSPTPVAAAPTGGVIGPAPAPPASAPPASAEPTPEQTAVIVDLHWLIHQGHVMEFANGMLDTAKRPIPRPPKPEPKPAAKPAELTAVEAPAATADTEPGAGEEPAPAEAVPAGDPEFSTEAPQSGTAEAPGSESGKPGEPAMPITSAEPAVAPEMSPAETAQAPVETPAAVTPAT